MTTVLIPVGFLAIGLVLARLAYVQLEVQEHDVLHTHPKLVAVLIVCGSLILGVQGAGVRLAAEAKVDGANAARDSAEALRLVRLTVDPDGNGKVDGPQAGGSTTVADVEEVAIAAAYCGAHHDDLAAVRACVLAEVQRLTGRVPDAGRVNGKGP